MAEKHRAMYKGDGSRFLNGIPARHLTEDDWNDLDTDQRAEVRASGLYDVRTNAEMSGAGSSKASAPDSSSGTGATTAGPSA